MRRYRVAEVFYSLQGEGARAGIATVFCRFAGCNLHCDFCDTDHNQRLSASGVQVVDMVKRNDPHGSKRVVLTGGEPLLQLDLSLIMLFQAEGYALALETNGTVRAPDKAIFDWVTVSPKRGAAYQFNKAVDEWRSPVRAGETPISPDSFCTPSHRIVSPIVNGNKEHDVLSMNWGIEWCLNHPEWSLSVQQHKQVWNIR
jgi:organic radical activating enzyme